MRRISWLLCALCTASALVRAADPTRFCEQANREYLKALGKDDVQDGWAHYKEIGSKEGRAWPSHLCPAACTGVQQNTYATLRCQAGAIIANITKANYGELDVETCAPTGKCQTLGAARALNAACARRQVCLVNITDSLFGAEPCAGVQKILTVHDGRCQARSEEYVLEGRDWHSAQIPAWREHVLELIAAHENESLPLHALDVGCGEGSAATWILDEAVRHPASSLTAVDTFEESTTSGGGDPVSRFLQNVERTGRRSRVTLLRMRSDRALAELGRYRAAYFDLINVDGSQRARDVLSDAVLAWPLLAHGGVMVLTNRSAEALVAAPVAAAGSGSAAASAASNNAAASAGASAASLRPHELPRVAVEAFLAAYAPELTVLGRGGEQVFVKKL